MRLAVLRRREANSSPFAITTVRAVRLPGEEVTSVQALSMSLSAVPRPAAPVGKALSSCCRRL